MLQRFFAALRAHYGMTVFVLYLCAFGIAFVGTFTLPLISIFMVLLSIFLLVPAVLLGDAIGANDFTVIYGVVLFITIAVATLMVFVEMLYPLLDPRIRQD